MIIRQLDEDILLNKPEQFLEAFRITNSTWKNWLYMVDNGKALAPPILTDGYGLYWGMHNQIAEWAKYRYDIIGAPLC